MSQDAKPCPAKARELLRYDEAKGALVWTIDRGGMKADDIAGCPNDAGYWVIKIDGKRYKRSRLTWFICKGQDPDASIEIDHKDTDKANDRIENLRLATHGQNMANKPITVKASGLPKGIRLKQGKNAGFQVRISEGGKRRYAGPYRTLEQAQAKADAMRATLHGEYANTTTLPPA